MILMPQWCQISNLNSIQLHLLSLSRELGCLIGSSVICEGQKKSWGGAFPAF